MNEGRRQQWEVLRAALVESRKGPALRRCERQEYEPASFSQQRLWFVEQLTPGRGAYHESNAFRVGGVLDCTALEKGLAWLVERHEILRTVFVSLDGVPHQRIVDAFDCRLEVTDLRALPMEAREGKAARIATRAAQQPFDLERGPLWRFALARLRDDLHHLIVTNHHIIWDQWSLDLFMRELVTAYEAFSRGAVPALPAPPLHYADFARWQRARLTEDVLTQQLSYWKARLGQPLPLIRLPLDHPRPNAQDNRGATHWFEIEAGLANALAEFGHAEGATSYVVYLAGLMALLARISGQRDILVAAPVVQRNHHDLKCILGGLTNLLPLRVDVSCALSFRVLLQRVREVVLAAYRNQDVPFERLVKEIPLKRSLGQNPLSQILFTMYKMPQHGWQPHGLKLTPLDFELGRVRSDLELFLIESPARTHGKILYRTKLFEPHTIERLLVSLRVLMVAAVREPDRPIAYLPLLSEEEKGHVLRELSGEVRGAAADVCIHQLFEKWAARAPGSPALVFGEERWSYAALNDRANRLAGVLLAFGVRPGVFVGVCLGPSPEMICGFLAILKAGGAYVPMDPGYPPARLQLMIEDAHIGLVLAHADPEGVFEGSGCRVLDVAHCGNSATIGPARNVRGTATQDDPAYLMYSSGSTGNPKGIAVPHRAVRRLVNDADYVQITSEHRIGQASHPCFDAATFEIWGALANGACLIGISKTVLLAPRALERQIREDAIHVLFVTTALFHLVASERPTTFATLTWLLFGGEKIDPACVRKIVAGGLPTHLLHVYGPTENTTFSTWFPVRDVPAGAHTIPIGRALTNTQTYVLDERLEVLPVGVPGELYLGGEGLATGYLGKPEQTAAAFVANPYGAPGSRLYKTGDLVRFLPDGNLEFLARLDDQVKVRGFRVEPGEIESTLVRHPHVQEALVVVHEEGPTGDPSRERSGDKRLLACIVPAQEHAPTFEELRAFLKRNLPAYMIPSAFIPLESLPLGATGKRTRELNARTIQQLVTRSRVQSEPVAPRTLIEQRLAAIWKDVLWLDRDVSVHEDFFDLGGHSLLAVRLVSEMEKALEREVPLAALFQLTTIAELARHLEAASDKEGIPNDVAAGPVWKEDQQTVMVIDLSLPYFDRDSGSQRLYQILRIMRSLGLRVLFVPTNDIRAEPYAAALAEIGIEVLTTTFAAGSAISLEEQVRRRLPEVDVAWICKPGPFEQYAPLVRERPQIRLVYDTIDLHFVRLRRAWENAGQPRDSAQEREWRALRDQELGFARSADVTIAITKVEQEILAQEAHATVTVIPNIHSPYDGRLPSFAEREGILFIGFYTHAPNVDAAVWLCESIMPRVWRELPNVPLTLLGSKPPSLVKNLASEQVRVPGYIADVSSFFLSHRVFASPLLYGAGMKGKAGQCLEFALPMVSTSIGTEGMDLIPGVDVLEANDAESFARELVRLYRDESLWNRLSKNSGARVARYTPALAQHSVSQVLGLN